MTPDNTFKKRAFLLSSLVRLGIHLSTKVYDFCDSVISDQWIPPNDRNECDMQVLEMYRTYMNGVVK